MEDKSLKIATYVKGFQRQRLFAGLALLSASSVLLLSGCSSAYKLGGVSTTEKTEVASLSGKVHGAQFPVTGATISLYEIGNYGGTGSTHTGATTAGYAAALPTALETATTDSNGNWSMSSTTCTGNAADELYLVATNGNPGQTAGTNNTALILTSVVGPCGGPYFSTTFDIDEVTTVATEFALAGFSTDYAHVGTSATNTVGLTNAFATVPNLVNLSTSSVTQGSFGPVSGGSAWNVVPAYATPPANTTPDLFHGVVPYDTINTLANVLATCVNTTGGSSSQCQSLFAITGGSLSDAVGSNGVTGPVATNTADAALFIAHNPGLPAASSFQNNNLSNLYALITAPVVFSPYLSTPPVADYSLTLNFVGGGLGGINSRTYTDSQYIAIDAAGNLWIPNSKKAGLFELNNLGTPISPTTTVNTSFVPIQLGGYQSSSLTNPTGLAIDQTGNVWVGDSSNCLTEYVPGTGFNTNAPFTGVCGSQSTPLTTGVSVDAANQVWISGEHFISAASSSTGAIVNTTNFPYTNVDTLTGFIGPDYGGHTYYIDGGNGSFGALNESGTLSGASGTQFSGPSTFAAFGIDTGGGGSGLSLWVPEPGISTLQPINTGQFTTVPAQDEPPTMLGPGGIAVDGNSRVYIGDTGSSADNVPDNLTVLLSNGSTTSTYATGYTGGSALTQLDAPNGVAVDQSGNVWVLNANDYLNSSNSSAQGYKGNGEDSSNVTEFVGLAAPSNPVFTNAAAIGATSSTAAGAYGVKP
jgi:hypothetical protein